MQILEKGSELCRGCKLYGPKCHCLCHVRPLIGGRHEIIWEEPAQPIVHPEDNDPNP